MKLSDYVMDFLARQGLKHLFLLPGGGSMHLVDSAGRNHDFQFVCCLHEQACAFAAEAYAEFTQGLGAALVTTGPGGTNSVTGVAAAWMESASCVFISGQVKRADRIADRGVRTMGPQEVDIISIVQPITKYAVAVLDPETIRYHLEKAVYLATHGRRGPVWLDIPLDVQSSIVDETRLQGFAPDPPVVSDELRQQVSAAIDLLNQAQRPVLFLGNGARAAEKSGELRKLIDHLEIPVLLTWKIADLLAEDDPYYAGRPGGMGQRGANFTQQNADCLMVIGARLDLPQTAFSHRNFARAATKILVDVDPAEIGKMQMPIDVPVCADAAAFVHEFLEQSGRLTPRNRSCWLRRVKEWQTRYPVVLPEYWAYAHSGLSAHSRRGAGSGSQADSGLNTDGGPQAGSGPSTAGGSQLNSGTHTHSGHRADSEADRRQKTIVCPTATTVNTYVLMDVLSDELTTDDVLVPGSSGPCSDIFMQAFRVKPGQRIVNAPGLGAMGTGLPGSLGACLASGRRRTVCVNGDGGFQLNIQDLETVRRLNLPIKYFVLCNGAYASIMTTQRNYFQGRYVASDPSSALTLPDIVKVAAAYGIRTAEIHSHGDLRSGVREVLSQDGPVVCAVSVSAEQATAPRVTSAVRPDGTLVSKPMEDMWPFLPREEFLANMIVPPLEES
jgi:thiamine pyrophosphate-dependent acetolactate synthase large subunit-like protein